MTFTVSMQPGNNYRGAASTSQSAVTGTTQAHADANTAPEYVKMTEMLTVWRRVWLELDSMAYGTDLSFSSGWIDSQVADSPHVGDTTLLLDVPAVDEGRFEGGTLTVTDTGSVYSIIDNVEMSGPDQYVVATAVAPQDINHFARGVDDDAFVLPRTPNADIGVLNDKYKPCYVEFFENCAVRDNNTAFLATLEYSGELAQQKGQENQDLHPAPDFWTALVVSAFQVYHQNRQGGAQSLADLDPDFWYHTHGDHPNETFWKVGDQEPIYAITVTATVPVSNVTIVFQEIIRDYVAQLAADPHNFPQHWRNQTHAFVESRVIAHEIAHQFGYDGHIFNSLVDLSWSGSDDPLFGIQIAYIRASSKLGEE